MFSMKKTINSLPEVFILMVIIALGFILRIYQISELPSGLHIDEIQVGYNALSLAQTGKDELGTFLPTHLPIWGYERPAGIFYLTIPGVLVFGLNEMGTRFPSVILGTLTIVLVYFVAIILFKNKRVALISSFLLAVSPWHIVLSRATSEAVVSLFFYLAGTILFLIYSEINKNKFFLALVGYLLYLISFFSYHSTRLTIPIVMLFLAILAVKEKKQNLKILLFFFLLYLIFPLALFYKTSMSRFNQVSVFHEPGTQLILEEQIREDGAEFPYLITRLVHNKLVNYSLRLSQNISSYFTYDFLLYKGGAPARYIVPNMGLIYFLELPFFIWGIILFFRKSFLEISLKYKIFIAMWIFLGVFSSSLTTEETPNIQRALFVLPMIQLIIAYGFLDLYTKINSKLYKRVGVSILAMIFIFNIYYFFHQYFIHTVTHQPWHRFYEMKELASYINSVKGKYGNIYLTQDSTEPYIFLHFYNQTPVKTFQEMVRQKGLSYVWNNYENVKIVREDCPYKFLKFPPKDLLIIRGICKIPPGAKIIKTINYTDGNPALYAIEKVKSDNKLTEQSR